MKNISLANRYAEAVGERLAVSYFADLLFISVTRWILRVGQRWHSFGIVLMFIGNIALSTVFIFAPVLFAAKFLNVSRVEDWGKLLGDSAAVTAMLDRLLHHGHLLKCGPRSWRTKTDAPEH